MASRAAIIMLLASCVADPAPDPACEVVVMTSPAIVVEVLAGAVCDGDGWVLQYDLDLSAGLDGVHVINQVIHEPCGARSDLIVLAGSYRVLEVHGRLWRGPDRTPQVECTTRMEQMNG